MKHVTKVLIYLEVEDGKIEEAVLDLPDYCKSTFEHTNENAWFGEFVISCPEAPKLADGDLVDDFASYFPALLKLKNFYSAKFELHIAVGEPAEEFFSLDCNMVALFAALGASIEISSQKWSQQITEQGSGGNG